MHKTPEQSFEEMINRNHNSELGMVAYTVWRNEWYTKVDMYKKFRKFARWYDPSWTLPKHVQDIVDLYSQYSISHKIIACDVGEGVKVHLNPSVSKDPRDWRKWKTWSYSTVIPFDLNAQWDPVKFVYDEYLDLENVSDYPMDTTQIEKMKVIECEPFTRISFPSSSITHGVLPSNNKLYWVFFDLWIEDESPFKHVDAKVITDLEEKRKDFVSLLSMKNHKGDYALSQMFMSDFGYLMTSRTHPQSFDYVPPFLI